MNKIIMLSNVMGELDKIGAKMKKHGNGILDDPHFQRDIILLLKSHVTLSPFNPPKQSTTPESRRESLMQSLTNLRKVAKSKLESIPMKLPVAKEITSWDEACTAVKDKISVFMLRLGGSTPVDKIAELRTETQRLVKLANKLLAAPKRQRNLTPIPHLMPRYVARAIHARRNELLDSLDCLTTRADGRCPSSPPSTLVLHLLDPPTLVPTTTSSSSSSSTKSTPKNPFENLPPTHFTGKTRRSKSRLSLSNSKNTLSTSKK